MKNEEKNRDTIKKSVYNLEFPPWCRRFKVFDYEFSRVENYGENVLRLQHLIPSSVEYAKKYNTGTHVHTAMVELPLEEQKAVLKWSDNKTALMDILLLLSIFTRRDVFFSGFSNYENLDEGKKAPIIQDPRVFPSGKILRTSIQYKEEPIEPESLEYCIGFEQGLNQVYGRIRSDEWQKEYESGYFLLLAKSAFQTRNLESSFILFDVRGCGTK